MGGKTMQADAKARAPKRTGALRTSIGLKVQVKGSRAGAVVGPRRKYQKKKQGKTIKPVRYAHILEFGGKGRSARPFLAPTMTAHRRQYLEAVRREIEAGIAAALPKA